MIDNTYVADSKIHGKGLFAFDGILAGSIIGWLTGKRGVKDGDYVLWVSESQGIEF